MSYIVNSSEILQTIEMINQQHLDVRTVTMGISLLDCADSDMKSCCDKIKIVGAYNALSAQAAPEAETLDAWPVSEKGGMNGKAETVATAETAETVEKAEAQEARL